mmetsp:Transcript_1986/g.7663  ORF Transcript_1986/g.7663 Transcript_1986/m.7663 type:complete len:205 (-) Transcript_1986:2259-2873(-)
MASWLGAAHATLRPRSSKSAIAEAATKVLPVPGGPCTASVVASIAATCAQTAPTEVVSSVGASADEDRSRGGRRATKSASADNDAASSASSSSKRQSRLRATAVGSGSGFTNSSGTREQRSGGSTVARTVATPASTSIVATVPCAGASNAFFFCAGVSDDDDDDGVADGGETVRPSSSSGSSLRRKTRVPSARRVGWPGSNAKP